MTEELKTFNEAVDACSISLRAPNTAPAPQAP
jgi:hypothetical protein